MGNMFLLSRASRLVCSSLQLTQTQPLNTLPNHAITLALSNYRMSEMKNGSFSWLDLLEISLWSILPPEAMMLSMVHAVAPDQVEALDSCVSPWSGLPLEAMLMSEAILMSVVHTAMGRRWPSYPQDYVDVHGLCSLLKPHWGLSCACL